MATALLIGNVVLVVLLILHGTGRAAEALAMPTAEHQRFTGRAGLMLLAWVAFVAIVGTTGVMTPQYLPFFMVAVLLSAVSFARSPVGRLLETLPYSALVGFQSFRILTEVYLYLGFKAGRVPIEMTVAGQNFDLFFGISALLLAPILAIKAFKPAVWAWSIIGTVLLMTVVSSHKIFFPESLAHFPSVLFPGVLVWAAAVGHLVVFQKLLARD